jgi:hypothetical protein
MLMVDYRLAPEHPFPAALEDAWAVYQALMTQAHPPKRLLMGGDSAGGNIALVTLQTILKQSAAQPTGRSGEQAAPLPLPPLTLPKAFFLVSPWLDLSDRNASVLANEETDVMLNQQILDEFRQRYAPDVAVTNPRLSPIHGRVDGLPPCLIIASQAEGLLDDSIQLHQKILAQHGASELLTRPKLPHAFPVMVRALPEARQALDQLALWLDRH